MPCVASGQMKGATCTFIDVVVHGGGGWGKHDGYTYVQILLCMDISSIMKMLNNFQGPLGVFFYVLESCLFDVRYCGGQTITWCS